jgi:hypothetical protein
MTTFILLVCTLAGLCLVIAGLYEPVATYLEQRRIEREIEARRAKLPSAQIIPLKRR